MTAVIAAILAAAACTTADRAAAPAGATATTAQARIEVPDVVGMVTSAARMKLLDAGLAV